MYIDHNLPTHSFVVCHSGRLHILAIVPSVEHRCAYRFFQIIVFVWGDRGQEMISLGHIWVLSYFFEKYSYCFTKKLSQILLPTRVTGGSFHPVTPTLDVSRFFIIFHSYIVVICTSVIISKDEHFSLPIGHCMFSLGKCPFVYSSYIWVELLDYFIVEFCGCFINLGGQVLS